jgi:hypothetical protein
VYCSTKWVSCPKVYLSPRVLRFYSTIISAAAAAQPIYYKIVIIFAAIQYNIYKNVIN